VDVGSLVYLLVCMYAYGVALEVAHVDQVHLQVYLSILFQTLPGHRRLAVRNGLRHRSRRLYGQDRRLGC